jgi:hypothetical protein
MMGAGSTITPKQVTDATLKGLWVPDWEIGQVDGVYQQLTDWSGNGLHLTQSTTASQPLFHRDTTSKIYNGKWYITFDGVDDLLSNISSPLSTGNGQLFIILDLPTNLTCGIFTTKFFTFNYQSGGVFLRTNSSTTGNGSAQPLSSVLGGSSWNGKSVALLTRKLTAGTVYNLINGFTPSTGFAGISDTQISSGIQLGLTPLNSIFFAGNVALIALYEGPALTATTIAGLMKYAEIEFGVYKNYATTK